MVSIVCTSRQFLSLSVPGLNSPIVREMAMRAAPTRGSSVIHALIYSQTYLVNMVLGLTDEVVRTVCPRRS